MSGLRQYHKKSPKLIESSDTFWLPKYFEYKENSQIFKIQIVKPILKHVTPKFVV